MIEKKKIRKKDKKTQGLVFWIVLGVMLVYLTFFHKVSFMDILTLKYKNSKLKQRVRILKHENEQLKEKNRLLEEDPKEIERLARENFGMKKEGEEVIRFYQDEKDKDSN